MDFDKLSILERKIIVGIDFGTTYSGVAWAETQRPDRRVAITSWPISKTIREGESSDKVPSKLRYSGKDVEWGFSIPVTAPTEEVIEWFKLGLDGCLDSIGGELGKKASANIGDVDKVITDYISALGDHLMYTLREKLGEGVVKNTPLELVVTVPAIWSEQAKERTKQACQRARGLSLTKSTIHLVSEPEAAAMYALQGLDPHNLLIGDSFVICDAGGGTVDLITYTIVNLKPALEVRETAPGTGALCGSTYINMRFRNFLKRKLGGEEGFDDEVLAEAMEKFEKTIKRQYTLGASPDDTFPIPVGGMANNSELGINRGRFALRGRDIREIFEPVIREVIQLVMDQIRTSKVPIRAVLLVGGFGSSNYLKERLRNAIGNNIHIMQPPNAWLAVVHGAVMKGLALSMPENNKLVRVGKRKGRKHYGTEWRTQYDPLLHGNIKKHWCGLDGCYKVYTMEWFIKRGDDISENEPFFTSFVWTGSVSQGKIRKIKMDIYTDRTARDAPIARDGDVSLLCHVEADISHIPESQFARRKGVDGQLYYELSCKIEAVYLSASTQYTLLFNGQRYNSVTTEYV
ncbi:hypothetical protein B0T26DRAFT_655976 [Lasiosphaeria miniovina]|uniref:Actin-like ATPase domain-containing protein n=1 Tax=Lasiosphaeria miniovina TaxID=1954250 RepID=A0AA39ZYL1_9PEZI|nr:uncharacterized protein B0T26DRAFT_655976 [Lasiosphaeria miniovina]KAK0706052.1 hypothetical protein B0T26DRAFT_655976 [Lasiosphaeria miniovina]